MGGHGAIARTVDSRVPFDISQWLTATCFLATSRGEPLPLPELLESHFPATGGDGGCVRATSPPGATGSDGGCVRATSPSRATGDGYI